MDPELANEIARLAHRCWCRRLLARGWTPGDRFDPDERTHDALRPFEQLSALDREQLARCAGWREIEKALADAAAAVLGERELGAADMRVGLPVRLAEGPLRADLSRPLGWVVSWEVASPETGRLALVRVRWDDGEVVDYAPSEHELEIVDEP